MTIRRIDLDTFRPNPSAGQQSFLIAGKKLYRADGDGWDRPVEVVQTLQPEGPWLFEWEPLEVKCQHCDARYGVDDIKGDYLVSPDDDDEVLVSVCPKCGEHDPLVDDVQYETVEEALKRRGG